MHLAIQNWKRSFYTIWAGQAASLFTSAIVQYALIWHLTAETKSAAVLSVAMLVGFLPTAILSPFIGSVVDRYNRKRIMVLSDGSIALVSVIIAIAAMGGSVPVWLVLLVLFFRALGATFHQPCLQAVTPLIVPEDQLVRCNGFTFSFQCVSMIFSPALAAICFAAMPLWSIILLDVVGAGLGVLTVAISHVPKLEQIEKGKLHVVRDALDGLHILRKEKGLFYLTCVSAVFTVGYMPASSLYPLMCMDYFGGTATHAGIAESAFSVGMLIGSISLGIWGGCKNKMIPMTLSIVVLGGALWIMGLLPPEGFLAFVLLTLVSGLVVPFFSTLFMTMLQERIAPEFLGRVVSITSSIMTLASPVGLALSGLFAERIGISSWFVLSGVLTLLCAVLCMGIRSIRRVDLDRPQAETEEKAVIDETHGA